MLQISYIRQNAALVKERLAVKYFAETDLVDRIISLDDEKRKLQLESENIQSRANALSKEIGQLFAKGQKDEASSKKQEVESLNAAAKPVREKLTEAEKEIDELLVKLPNLPSEKVPAGRTPAENVTVKALSAAATGAPKSEHITSPRAGLPITG